MHAQPDARSGTGLTGRGMLHHPSATLVQKGINMARIRTVKPEFFRHYQLYRDEQETGLPLRLAFAGLWTACDREGRFKWQPETLKLDCLPHDQIDFSRVLDALTTRGYLVKYASNGCEYGCIPSFRVHQVINNRERASELPNPDNCQVLSDACPTRAPRDTEMHVHAQGEGKGRERNNPPISPQRGNGRMTPPSIEEVRAFVESENLKHVVPEAFVDHFTSNGWKVGGKAPMKSWQHALRNWNRRHNGVRDDGGYK